MRELALSSSLGRTIGAFASPCKAGYLISREHSLAYLPIPKNANSYLKAIFLANHAEAYNFKANQESALKYLNKNPKIFCPASWREVKACTRMTVLRDPLARLVSAFLDKVVKPEPTHHLLTSEFFFSVRQKTGSVADYERITFADFARYQLAVSDWRRNRHTRSQAGFIGQNKFDFYGDVADMTGVLDFLNNRGMSKIPSEFRSAKKTPYSDVALDGHEIAKVPAYQLRELRKTGAGLPTATAFYTPELLDDVVNAYRRDIQLYCEKTATKLDRLIDRYS